MHIISELVPEFNDHKISNLSSINLLNEPRNIEDDLISQATSDVTMFSTYHSKDRCTEREIDRRDVQSVIKHGSINYQDNGKRRVEYNDNTVILDKEKPVVVTTW